MIAQVTLWVAKLTVFELGQDLRIIFDLQIIIVFFCAALGRFNHFRLCFNLRNYNES